MNNIKLPDFMVTLIQEYEKRQVERHLEDTMSVFDFFVSIRECFIGDGVLNINAEKWLLNPDNFKNIVDVLDQGFEKVGGFTFSEAEEEVRKLSKRGTQIWYGPQLDKHKDIKGVIETGEVELIIDKLRKHYGHEVSF
ncbi:hypothetical protein R0H03_04090 [Pediococcus acidilactici]|uniref:Uncharacterized protein n=1 Tax=Pediococcus acidilactici TaxID=1254 RepID=A0AAW8YMV3_PEDAC|nr:hypothetical protein [Pediococcus acidilactici]MDV2911046.1 hypothetical protein [Pediococcus acidilactici]WQS17630.1 hypothetical protein SGW14_00915 [Pediococcus acidilactici]